MLRFLVPLPIAVWLVLLPGAGESPISAEVALPLVQSMQPGEVCLMPDVRPSNAAASGVRAVAPQRAEAEKIPAGWPGPQAVGGDVRPIRSVYDPHPVFNGMAIDAQNGVVVMSDQNKSSLLVYDVQAGGSETDTDTTAPRTHIEAGGFLAGVALDAKNREIITVSNDGGGLQVYSYDWAVDRKSGPVRELMVPHQAWGVSFNAKRNEIAVTSQQYQGISIYGRTASGADRPLRTIRGDKTMMADPHGIYVDPANNEAFVSNHGNWTEMRSYSADGPPLLVGEYKSGRFEQPSVRVYDSSANGDVPPLRTIQGEATELAWPMGIDVDAGELAVANYGSHNILIYSKAADGNVAPVRRIGGDKTGIVGPVAVSFDAKNGEIWVANYGDHTAVVFDRGASGNVAPKRIVRNAPAGTPSAGFTNASAAAYDSVRDQLLVPN